ncbi:MAG: histidine kinase [Leptothrix sp. (in: Bacteria)]|nr:histidine kinase [Leptothrix sp. (in: b-proteobacteria)]
MDATEADRRSGERRSSDRRGTGKRRRDDPLFDGFGATDSAGLGDSFFDPGWLASGEAPSDSRFLQRQARRIERAQDSALARVYRTYAAARAVIGIGLVGAQGIGSLLGTRGAEWLSLVSVLYGVQAISLWLLPRFRPLAAPQSQAGKRRRQWAATIGVDLLAFSLLHLLEVGTSLNYAALLVLPVLMAGVLTSRLLALGTAAGVALLLLLAAWRAGLGSDNATALMLQSGLAGLGMFMITLVSGELAGRLAREQLAARGSLELARQQAQLNRLVIEEMADGVLVIDRRLRVRAANPAARALLVDQGLTPPAPFVLHQVPAWAELLRAVELALAEGVWPDAGRDVMLGFGAGHTRTLRLRVRFMRGRGLELAGQAADDLALEPFAVLLLEDLRTLQARIRQEKLAAMGRVSAGIAHEIRNPLAAIAQANALLLEDPLAPDQQRLAQMVADNVERLKRLVDDVMEVAPGAAPPQRPIDIAAIVAAAATDWARTAGLRLGPDSRLRAELPASPLGAVFDPEHLRRVLVNLLDNAHRHAPPGAGAISLRLVGRDDGRVQLSVLSDGPPIAPEIERHLFEPFFSTRSRGSGLGLYICRELCERYGASIDYRPRPKAERWRNEFVVSMRRASLTDTAHTLPLEPV